MKRLLWILAFLICAVGPKPAFALVSISSSSAVVGPRLSMFFWPNESFTYTETGTFTGTMNLERSFDGKNYDVILSTINNQGSTFTGTLQNGSKKALYRWNASTVTAGNFYSVLSQNDDMIGEIRNLRNQQLLQYNDESAALNGTWTATTLKSTGDTIVGGFLQIAQSTAPRSATVGLTPSTTYVFVINTTDNEICFASATNKFSWVEIATPTAACKH